MTVRIIMFFREETRGETFSMMIKIGGFFWMHCQESKRHNEITS